MISANLLFDVSPISGIGAFLGIAFFFVVAAVAFIAYRMLRKTVKTAVRMTIVAAILIIALVGSIALLVFSSGGGGKRTPRPTPTQKSR